MQSSCNVIKQSSVIKDGNKPIVTEFQKMSEVQQKELGETNAKIFIESYENLARTMVEDARRQREQILSSAYAEAERISKEAYENAYQQGYNEGNQNGYNDGFNKAYEEGYKSNLDKALQEAELIKNNADNILKTSIEEKERYIKEKEMEIKDLIINSVESILKKEVKEQDGLNSIIFEALSKVKNTKTFIIKSNKLYCEEFKNQIDLWKEQLPFKGDIFIIPDESIEEGSAVIERDNGKVVVGTHIAMEKLRELINSVE